MVFINNNIYSLRDAFLEKSKELSQSDVYKHGLLSHLGYIETDFTLSVIQSFKKCAALGFVKDISEEEIAALQIMLGQAHHIDGTPSHWVSDIWGVLGIKIAVERINTLEVTNKFTKWIDGLLPTRANDNRLDQHEKAITDYILGKSFTPLSDPSIVLFLHFQNLQIIEDDTLKRVYIDRFFEWFKTAYKQDLSAPTLSVMVYVFDTINEQSASVPPNQWDLASLILFLENIPAGLRRWTWEDNKRTRNGNPIKWKVENEYHVQNLLYALLAPIFNDITDENYASPVGQKNPRLDLYLPSIHTIIEVKYRKDSQKSFQSLIGEVAEDAGLYKADPKFAVCKLVIFLWDNARATEEHTKFKEGVLKISGIDGCVVLSSPSVMV